MTEGDVIKHRNKYLETLDLMINIDKQNYDANKLYKETGQLVPVIGLADNRSIEEKLLDVENLKQNVAKSIATISSLTFGTDVVQRIMEDPLNVDNSLLIFTAQRIDEIINQLKKIYSIGIKGDKNDIQQIVNFITKMYTDVNSFTRTAKNFLDVQPNNPINPTGAPSLNSLQTLKPILNSIVIEIGKYNEEFTDYVINQVISPEIGNLSAIVQRDYEYLYDYITSLIEIIPTPTQINFLYELSRQVNVNNQEIEQGRRILEGYGLIFPNPNNVQTFFSKNKKFFEIGEILNKLLTYEGNVGGGLNPNDPFYVSLISSVSTALKKNIQVLNNFINLFQVSDVDLAFFEPFVLNFFQAQQPQLQQFQQAQAQQQVNPAPNVRNVINPIQGNVQQNFGGIPPPQPAPFGPLPSGQRANNYGNSSSGSDFSGLRSKPSSGSSSGSEYSGLESVDSDYSGLRSVGSVRSRDSIPSQQSTQGTVSSIGNGVKRRRGRPRGSGVLKPYSLTVKENLDLTRGIEPTGKFIKFGKYLLNSHKLNKENVFSLKHSSGGNIIDVPSTRLTEGLGKVIKTIIGGGNPSYGELNKLSENEQNYLHKICSKSNILDKISIPTPSKDSEEKEIHKFEVMKGEIASGNDSPELIKDFKRMILKLQKNNSLPKKEVYEILEELNTLGY